MEGTPINFLVDTGAEFSVLKTPLGKLRKNEKTLVIGATGQKSYPWTTARTVDLGRNQVTHSFLVIPECPMPLLGRDLLTKLKAQITFSPPGPIVSWGREQPQTLALSLQLGEEYRIYQSESKPSEGLQDWLDQFPQAWAETGGMGLARRVPPVVIELKSGATPIDVRQYPMSKEAREGIRPHITRLLQQGILVPCKSSWNTPLLPVKKPGTNDYRPVQDLREVNKRVQVNSPFSFVRGYKGAAREANPGTHSLQNPAVPRNSLTCRGVVGVGILITVCFLASVSHRCPSFRTYPR